MDFLEEEARRGQRNKAKEDEDKSMEGPGEGRGGRLSVGDVEEGVGM